MKRRGCVIMAILLAILLIGIVVVGFSAQPVDDLNAVIPTIE